ncbi:hypothetical protein B0H66DRAFT_535354 [Apodospora peruviana]|uniref:Uncharacterized protein n=1 Tax=Apodospora peruviana TaxID=516989 RepID=A0AAE0HX20_9PEZI|nr:hypothetical protein B0H66DRAFT_535354 [Apodospora peruviana]
MRTTLHPWRVGSITLALSVLFFFRPALAVLPDGDLPDCEEGKRWDSKDDMGAFWGGSGADDYAVKYIDANVDHSNWTQNLYMELFPDANHADMSCVSWGSQCQLKKTCTDFNNIKKGGLYYLYVSVQNMHNFMVELGHRMEQGIILASLSTGDFKADLGIEDPKNDDTKGYAVATLNILAGALGGAAAPAAFAGPEFAAILGAMAGVVQIIAAAVDGSHVEPTPIKNFDDDVKKAIGQLATQQWDAIDKIVGGVFGRQGSVQEDTVPKSMRRSDIKHPAVSVFSYGVWLLDNPNMDLADGYFEEVSKKLKQAIAWSLAWQARGSTVVLRDDLGQDRCNNKMNAWDAEHSICYDLMNKLSNNDLIGFPDDDALNKIWDKYGMDPMYTMRNSEDCWRTHKDGDKPIEPSANPFNGNELPKCFFAQDVHKGYFKSGKYINLDNKFPGQESGGSWPKSG